MRSRTIVWNAVEHFHATSARTSSCPEANMIIYIIAALTEPASEQHLVQPSSKKLVALFFKCLTRSSAPHCPIADIRMRRHKGGQRGGNKPLHYKVINLYRPVCAFISGDSSVFWQCTMYINTHLTKCTPIPYWPRTRYISLYSAIVLTTLFLWVSHFKAQYQVFFCIWFW